MAHLKKGPKIILAGVGLVAAIFVLRQPAVLAHLPSGFQKAITLGHVDMPNIKDAALPNVQPLPYPSSSTADVANTLFRGGIWEWNAQNGLILANGGKETTQGSLMQKYGVNLLLQRQDDTSKMQEGLVACAKELHDGAKQCSDGYNFVVIMGGGSPQFVAVTNAQLVKLGPEYKLKTIGAVGRSNGEDGFWAPSNVKQDPHSIASTEMDGADFGATGVTGGVLASGVIRDDDWNIAQKWAADNNVPNNPDEKTFDPSAINWVNSTDYIAAANDYVAQKCEDRMLVKQGHQTGQKVHVCVNAYVTWTPGDVIAATKRGGDVRVASSRDYYMPAVIVGIGKFFADNHDETVGMLAAALTAGDQIRAFDGASKKACQIAAIVYDDQGDTGYTDGAYWYKYFKGVTQPDAKGNTVPLGGSAVYGLDDNLQLFGVQEGANDDYRSLYNVFARIDTTEYPSLFKETPIPPVSDVELRSYIDDTRDKLSDAGTSTAQAASVDYSAQQSGAVLGDANYHVNFATGSAQPLPDGIATLNELRDSLAVTSAAIEVSGDTDNTGNPEANVALSEARARAVADYLHTAAPSSFPLDRFKIEGLGSSKPIASNDTADGRAQNRRVEITLRAQ